MKHPRPFASREQSRSGLTDLKRVTPRLLRYSLPYWRTLLIGLLALAGGSGINLFFPYYIREILNGKLGFDLERDLQTIVFSLVALFAVQACMFYLRHRSFASVGFRVVTDLRKSLFSALLSQDIQFFDASRVGDLMSRLSSDTQQVQNALTVNISIAIRYSLQVIGGIALMLFISPRLTLVILLLIPFLLVASRFWGVRLAKISREMQQELGESAVVAEEVLGSVRTVQMFAGRSYEEHRYGSANDRTLALGIGRAKFAAFFSSTMVFCIHTAIAIILWYGAQLVLGGTLTIGDLAAFLLYCVMVAMSLGFLISAIDEFFHAAGAGARILEILDLKPNIIAPPAPITIPSTGSPHVSFDRVSFAYPSRSETLVIKDLSFSVEDGQTVAIVGPSGAGKSTITALISRFYDPQQGVVRYRGHSVAEFDPRELRKEISIVAQDVTVFSTSIRENIEYGRIGATTQEIESAARAANLHDFIVTLPKAYDTLVGDRGVLLSGGQKQRLAIARALLKDPRLLILDEATSALDSENEQLVQQSLRELMHGRTTLIIAHRLSTVQHAHVVLVLKDGLIVESGTHDELIQRRGLYHSLVEHQIL